jgi:hydrogenase expression/formation protein HypD
MKYVDEFRNKTLAEQISMEINRRVTRPWKIMEVCGGQTHTILQYGVQELLPNNIELLHGPGCPVCVTPVELIDKAIAIANSDNVIFCSFGDMLRVPGSKDDLLQAKALGADVRIVYSPLDALNLAKKYRDRQIVFFAVGFETTAPANAMAVYQAKKQGVDNFFLLCSHVTVPPVISAIMQSPNNQVQAFLGPGHVCSVMGFHEYQAISEHYKIPIVISGFEPIDILEGILLCVKQLESGEAFVENQYSRAVSLKGNIEAQNILTEVFDVSDRQWRGLGAIPKSGFKLSCTYKQYDAEKFFEVDLQSHEEAAVCISGQILKGIKKPFHCSAFGTECTPEHPLGATMVSSEGTCSNYYKFQRLESLSARSN